MKYEKIGLITLLGALCIGCAGVEEGGEVESPDLTVSKSLKLKWIQGADFSDSPVLSFSRNYDSPTPPVEDLRFRAQPPLAVPGGVLCSRGGDLVYLDSASGEELWSVPVSTNHWLQLALVEGKIAVYEGSGRLLVLTLTGKRVGSCEVLSDALFASDDKQVYLLSRSGLQAYSVPERKVLWSRASSKNLRFHSLLAGREGVAVGYFSPSTQRHEVALIDQKSGLFLHRFGGRGLGFDSGSFFTAREGKPAVWEWKCSSGSLIRKHSLNAYDGGALFFHQGSIIYSRESRYHASSVTRIGRGGVDARPAAMVIRRELQRIGSWQVPYHGQARLFPEVLLDLQAHEVSGWNLSSGERLFHIQMKDSPRRASLGESHLFVLTRSGRLQAFEVRK